MCSGILSFDSEKGIVLTAKTKETHEKASRYLSDIAESTEILLPESAPKEVFELDIWKKTMQDIEAELPVVVQNRVRYDRLYSVFIRPLIGT